jgi:hypothetical protein
MRVGKEQVFFYQRALLFVDFQRKRRNKFEKYCINANCVNISLMNHISVAVCLEMYTSNSQCMDINFLMNFSLK